MLLPFFGPDTFKRALTDEKQSSTYNIIGNIDSIYSAAVAERFSPNSDFQRQGRIKEQLSRKNC
jgi:hypothetical protein